MPASLFVSHHQTIWQCNLETATLNIHQLENDVKRWTWANKKPRLRNQNLFFLLSALDDGQIPSKNERRLYRLHSVRKKDYNDDE